MLHQQATSNKPTVDLKYISLTALAVIFTWFLHEFSHWTMGVVLGNEMGMTLNTAFKLNNGYLQSWHAIAVSAAGPIVTLLQAVIVFFLMKKHHNYLLYPFLFTCLYMRVLAGFISLINPNDEARISSDLGIGMFTLPIIVSLFLFLLVYKTSKRERYSKKLNLLTYLLVMIFSSVIILSDQFFNLRIL